jgi:proteasome alpha subunit
MSMPFYVSPEQLMKDRADFARKGIARGRSVVVVQYPDGIVFVSENPSQALHKISEIYDRIAFAAVGRYNEFENLRIAGVRLADMRGYAYDRRDVTGRGLANAYAQTLGTIFSSGGEKPYEVEIFVAEVGDAAGDDQIYRLTYDGQIMDEHGFAVMGGSAEAVTTHLRERYQPDLPLDRAIRLAVAGLEHSESATRVVAAEDLEVAVLDRTRGQSRKFRRLPAEQLVAVLGDRSSPEPAGGGAAAPAGDVGSGGSEGEAGASGEDDPNSSGQPPVAPSVAPPVSPPVAPPVSPPASPPTDVPSGPDRPADPAGPPVLPEPDRPTDPGDPRGTRPPIDPSDPLS